MHNVLYATDFFTDLYTFDIFIPMFPYFREVVEANNILFLFICYKLFELILWDVTCSEQNSS